MISFSQVYKRYPNGFEALKNVSFTLETGEMGLVFRAIGIPMSEVYGMSENTGPMSFEMHKVKPGYVGRALPGTELVRVEYDVEEATRAIEASPLPNAFARMLREAR